MFFTAMDKNLRNKIIIQYIIRLAQLKTCIEGFQLSFFTSPTPFMHGMPKLIMHFFPLTTFYNLIHKTVNYGHLFRC